MTQNQDLEKLHIHRYGRLQSQVHRSTSRPPPSFLLLCPAQAISAVCLGWVGGLGGAQWEKQGGQRGEPTLRFLLGPEHAGLAASEAGPVMPSKQPQFRHGWPLTQVLFKKVLHLIPQQGHRLGLASQAPEDEAGGPRFPRRTRSMSSELPGLARRFGLAFFASSAGWVLPGVQRPYGRAGIAALQG